MVESQQSFVRYISHEMRTPLNTAYLGLQLLQEDFTRTQEVTRLETVKDIRESCDKAIMTLNEVLMMDKLESGVLMIEEESLCPYSLLLEALNPFHVQVCYSLPPHHRFYFIFTLLCLE